MEITNKENFLNFTPLTEANDAKYAKILINCVGI